MTSKKTAARCPNCGGQKVVFRIEPRLDFTPMCGLDNVVLLGVAMFSCESCASKDHMRIPSMEGLHNALACALLDEATAYEDMTSNEKVFLKTWSGIQEPGDDRFNTHGWQTSVVAGVLELYHSPKMTGH